MKLNWNFQKGGGGKDIFWNYTLKNGNQFEKSTNLCLRLTNMTAISMSITSGVKSALGELTKLSFINLNTPAGIYKAS